MQVMGGGAGGGQVSEVRSEKGEAQTAVRALNSWSSLLFNNLPPPCRSQCRRGVECSSWWRRSSRMG